MSLFKRFFARKPQKEKNQILYYPNSEEMEHAYNNARKTFKYFWREMYWENRRIIKAHNVAMVKMRFEQNENVEHMWLNDVVFDGDLISGTLVNSPGELTNVKVGDRINKGLNHLSDWLFVIQGQSFGGYTIQTMRAILNGEQLKSHDDKWGIDFGDYDDILVVYKQKEEPQNLIEHPMCINMEPKVREFYKQNQDEITYIDEKGLTPLHDDAIAGNKKNIEILLELGANKYLKSNSGKTPYEYASEIGWDHILEILK